MTPALPPIDGHTRLVGLLGWPVEHSRSPALHNATFAALGLNWRYVPLPVPPQAIEAAVRGLAALGFRGANVTVPHKQAVIPALTSLVPNARDLGAVNTIVIDRDPNGKTRLVGHNTDDRGFILGLRAGGFEPRHGKRAGVVGAGGAARAVVFALLWAGIDRVTVLNRTAARARTLVAELGGGCQYDAERLEALALTPEALVECAQEVDLLVNATTVGMTPHVEASIWPDAQPFPAHLTVFDLVYAPRETRLLRQARAAGARPIDGLGMLINQAAIAFSLWTGAGPAQDIAALMMKEHSHYLHPPPIAL